MPGPSTIVRDSKNRPPKSQLRQLRSSNLDHPLRNLDAAKTLVEGDAGKIPLKHPDHHAAESIHKKRLAQSESQFLAHAAALVGGQKIDRVELAVVTVHWVPEFPPADESEDAPLVLGDKDKHPASLKVLHPTCGAFLDIQRGQEGLRDDPGIGFPPAFNLDKRNRQGILGNGPANLEIHEPQSTTIRLRLNLMLIDRIRYPGTMQLPSLPQIRDAQAVVYRHMPPTPQYTWPLLNQRLQAEAWVKHENHTPVGAFKLRGALVYMDWLKQSRPELAGVVAATRGNHGQGVGMAARLAGLRAVIVVPHGNSKEKNRAMLAQGVELVEHGDDFQESLEFARSLAVDLGFPMVDSFHERLVMGTATYALELFEGAPALDTVYVPIGLGSSICGVSAARNALGLKTKILGVVAAQSPSYALSFSQRAIVEAPSLTAIADGLACRTPNPQAMEVIWENVARIVQVSDQEIAAAMRAYYQDTHNLAEGAGAAALAGALQECRLKSGGRIGVVLTGGNVDREAYQAVLGAEL